MKRTFILLMLSMIMATGCRKPAEPTPPTDDVVVEEPVVDDVESDVNDQPLPLGEHIFVRIFKEEQVLELWTRGDAEQFRLVRRYPICKFSGHLGPKLRQGDRQSPEGFYEVMRGQMNPNSRYHLAFNIGYPNAFDRAHERTGSAIMVHGRCVSVGCYAMTDPVIEELYGAATAAFEEGQASFRVHVFPFRMTDAKMTKHRDSEWYPFWQNLKEGYDVFESEGVPPSVTVHERLYVFEKSDDDIAKVSEVERD